MIETFSVNLMVPPDWSETREESRKFLEAQFIEIPDNNIKGSYCLSFSFKFK